MIQLTRLNNQSITVNSDLVKLIEKSPDTVISLVNGEKFIVRESVDEVVHRIVEFRRLVLRGVYPQWDHVPVLAPAASETGPPCEPDGR